MKVIITFTFCCDSLWKSKFRALEKLGKLREFFVLLFGHPECCQITRRRFNSFSVFLGKF